MKIVRILLAVVALLVAGCAALWWAVPVPGVRLLRAEYAVDGETVLETYYSDPDADRAERVWDYLDDRPSMADAEKLPPHDGLRRKLDGTVVVTVLHTDSVLWRAELVDAVRLRDTTDDARWYLAPESWEQGRTNTR